MANQHQQPEMQHERQQEHAGGPPLPVSAMLAEEIAPALNISPAYRGMQIFKALWDGAVSFNDISTLPKKLRSDLNSRAQLYETKLRGIQGEGGDAEKLIISCSDGYSVESVVLTDGNGRKTACLSTQAGCAMGCAFCKTGTLGFSRNLSVGEITEQVLHAVRQSGTISNIVFMGMGEPLANFDNAKIERFEVAEPSVEDIFVSVVQGQTSMDVELQEESHA